MKNKHEQIVRGGIQDRILMGKRAVADTGERSPLCVRRFSVALAACFAVAGASCVKVGLDRRSGEETPRVPLISTPVVESPEVGDRTFREVGGTSRDEEETRPPVLVSRITEDHVESQIDVPASIISQFHGSLTTNVPIGSDFISNFAAHQLVHGFIKGFSGDVPQ